MTMKNDEMKCYCGKWAKPAVLKIEGLSLRGWKCSCGEQYLEPEDSLRLSAYKQLKTKQATGTVTRTGNSLAIRVSKEIATVFRLKPGEKVRLDFESPTRFGVISPA